MLKLTSFELGIKKFITKNFLYSFIKIHAIVKLSLILPVLPFFNCQIIAFANTGLKIGFPQIQDAVICSLKLGMIVILSTRTKCQPEAMLISIAFMCKTNVIF